MKPVYQTTFGEGAGNCFQAALASIFELPLEEVPNFCCVADPSDWYSAANEWLGKKYGLWLLLVGKWDGAAQPPTPRGYHLISGRSPRRGVRHSVVGLNGQMVHDPHPSGDGLAIEDTYDLFVCTFERANPVAGGQPRED